MRGVVGFYSILPGEDIEESGPGVGMFTILVFFFTIPLLLLSSLFFFHSFPPFPPPFFHSRPYVPADSP